MGIARHLTRLCLRGSAATDIALIAGACGALLFATTVSHAGPCTAQIAQLQLQIKVSAPGPTTGPTAPQTVGAQLHHQPTPGTVEHAEISANADADAALDRARKADADGNARGCKKALRAARRLYGVD
jgi:hypothetical protein